MTNVFCMLPSSALLPPKRADLREPVLTGNASYSVGAIR